MARNNGDGALQERTGGLVAGQAHPQRAAVLGEVHARPFQTIHAPHRIVHVALLTDAAETAAIRATLASIAMENALPPPAPDARYHRMSLGPVALRWESHAEFTTIALETSGEGAPFAPWPQALASRIASLDVAGQRLVAVDFHLVADDGAVAGQLDRFFDVASLAASHVAAGTAIVATDFRADGHGMTRFLVIDRGLTPPGAGALCQRLLEIETYRTLALLGLPQAQKLSPGVRRVEDGLASIASAMQKAEGLDANHRLLAELTSLAAELEADIASASFRFGASRAYDEIVEQRLAAIGEARFETWPTLASFLARRLAPAMRTCRTTEERQTALSERLARAANLLRTRVDVEIEQQNRDVLQSMNKRARMQLRLQQTVEGLSVAAISYYVVSLAAYVFKGLKDIGRLPVDPGLATALSVPVAVLGVWWVVRRIRNSHGDGE